MKLLIENFKSIEGFSLINSVSKIFLKAILFRTFDSNNGGKEMEESVRIL